MVAAFWVPMGALALLSLAVALWIGARIGRLSGVLETLGEAQARFLDELPGSRIPLAIVVSAGASLFLELAIIRWHGTEWEVFAFYKNFSLLGCFLGLGLGYALARQPRIPAVAVLPLLAFEVAYLLMLRHAVPGAWILSLRATPFVEQLNMGPGVVRGVPQYVALYGLLTQVLLATALAFIPIGQICGRLLDRLPRLTAYGWNLAGSLAGVALMFLTSFLWTPPIIWFALASLPLVWLQPLGRRAVVVGLPSIVLLLCALAWPVEPGVGTRPIRRTSSSSGGRRSAAWRSSARRGSTTSTSMTCRPRLRTPSRSAMRLPPTMKCRTGFARPRSASRSSVREPATT